MPGIIETPGTPISSEGLEYLQINLRILKAKLKAQRNFSMNISMHVAATITESEIKEVKLLIKEKKLKS